MLGLRIRFLQRNSGLKLKSMRECEKDRRLQWFGHLEKMEECVSSSKCRNFKVIGSFPRE